MKRTKLEEYIVIIEILQKKGPLNIVMISRLGSIDNNELSKELDFLLVNKIIEKQDSCGSQSYRVSPLGNRIIKYFSQHTLKLQSSNKSG